MTAAARVRPAGRFRIYGISGWRFGSRLMRALRGMLRYFTHAPHDILSPFRHRRFTTAVLRCRRILYLSRKHANIQHARRLVALLFSNYRRRAACAAARAREAGSAERGRFLLPIDLRRGRYLNAGGRAAFTPALRHRHLVPISELPLPGHTADAAPAGDGHAPPTITRPSV